MLSYSSQLYTLCNNSILDLETLKQIWLLYAQKLSNTIHHMNIWKYYSVSLHCTTRFSWCYIYVRPPTLLLYTVKQLVVCDLVWWKNFGQVWNSYMLSGTDFICFHCAVIHTRISKDFSCVPCVQAAYNQYAGYGGYYYRNDGRNENFQQNSNWKWRKKHAHKLDLQVTESQNFLSPQSLHHTGSLLCRHTMLLNACNMV